MQKGPVTIRTNWWVLCLEVHNWIQFPHAEESLTSVKRQWSRSWTGSSEWLWELQFCRCSCQILVWCRLEFSWGSATLHWPRLILLNFYVFPTRKKKVVHRSSTFDKFPELTWGNMNNWDTKWNQACFIEALGKTLPSPKFTKFWVRPVYFWGWISTVGDNNSEIPVCLSVLPSASRNSAKKITVTTSLFYPDEHGNLSG